MFHALDDEPSAVSFPPRSFQRGLLRLKERGYRTVSLLEAAGCLRLGGAFPERAFVITFDDGYRSVYEEAFPILQLCGFSATVFLTVGDSASGDSSQRLPSTCRRQMLSWGEIREMQRWGFSFGAHTLTHPDLTRLRPTDQEKEILGSKAVIENRLGVPVASFAYPFGRYNARSRELVSRNFDCGCSDRLALVRAGSDPYAMERVDACYLRAGCLLEAVLSPFFPWYLRARSLPRQLRRRVANCLAG